MSEAKVSLENLDTPDAGKPRAYGTRSAVLRPIRPGDAAACGRIAYAAFRDIAERHGFPPDFPSPEVATGLITDLSGSPGIDGFVAEEAGEIVGSILVSRRSPVGGISIVSVDPRSQNRRVGRSLMQHGMAFLSERGHERQQLVQAGYHNRSLCLYAKLGFEASAQLSMMTGGPIGKRIAGRAVRPALSDDAPACDALCRAVHGFDRSVEVAHAIARGRARVVESGGRITGYATEVGFTGHGVGESLEDLKALIAGANEITGPGLLVPTSNGELFRWCLDHGLRVVQQMTLMDTNPQGSPRGAWWPAVLC